MTDPSSPSFKRILVPVDFVDAGDEELDEGSQAVVVNDHRIVFTAPTLRAVTLATAIGRTHGSTVRLVHSTPPLQTSTVYSGPVALPSQLIQEIHDRAKATSTEALEKLVPGFAEGITLEYAVRPGQPLAVVLEEAERFGPDLIVMAASGRSRVARFFVGSTADRVIRQAPCPVMVVPADVR
ncbi:universal stress protein [Paraliomyxa miuraensis]|uniref:universal stress protein n=1 Tax=Paraliomyxa miuraensis TaxID=376150 RepID=UPI00225647F2|nr:universal stress protein [Paraliomyxa miuraensis]MCX4246488.1 universal stress protein [Paraliomyxa miuraensis]